MSDESLLLAVTGQPVFHSLSPELFRILLKISGVAASYTRLAAASAEEALRLFSELGLDGMNVTAPFKEGVRALLGELGGDAALLGAVNCVARRPDGGLYGDSSDPSGVGASLKAAGVRVGGRRCLVIGAGGAGKSAALALVREGASVEVVNRSVDRSDAFFGELGCGMAGLDLLAERAASADIIVSTLASANLPPIEAWFPRGASRRTGEDALVVFDADYREGLLHRHAKAAGCLALSGLGWLIHQALPAFELFVGRRAAAIDPALIESELRDHDRARRKGRRGLALFGASAELNAKIASRLAPSLGLPQAKGGEVFKDTAPRGQDIVSLDEADLADAASMDVIRKDHAVILLYGKGRGGIPLAGSPDLVMPCAGRGADEIAEWIHEEVAQLL
ncbi:MAG TPA: hypothetical protein VMV44_06205 [Rectinemataceae bacterium]|nr:hypothetical protein [Rectinemataceae bacterium]